VTAVSLILGLWGCTHVSVFQLGLYSIFQQPKIFLSSRSAVMIIIIIQDIENWLLFLFLFHSFQEWLKLSSLGTQWVVGERKGDGRNTGFRILVIIAAAQWNLNLSNHCRQVDVVVVNCHLDPLTPNCGMKKVSIVFTASTSDSEFPFVCPGFGPINSARQSQELKLKP